MPRAHRPSAGFPAHLQSLYARFPFDRSISADPIGPIRRFAIDRRHAEVTGIYGATLAVGNTAAIRGAIADLVDRAGGDLVRFILEVGAPERLEAWRSFRHRWIRGDQMLFLGERLRSIYARHESLEEVFLLGLARSGFAGGIDSLARELRGNPALRPRAPPGYRALFPSPLDPGHSPAKRLTLYVRWMARERFPDLGYWTRVPTGELRIPLDQHVHWIAYHLGLTGRRTRSWQAVEEVTEALRRIDPIDPVKYDFVLCHTGVSGDCPKTRDIAVCGPCVVRPDCRLWHGRTIQA